MRKIIAFDHVSLDGFASGPNGELDWLVYNGEIFKDAIALTDTADAAIYGRVTYQMMAGYWPTVPSNPDSSADDIHHANWVEHAQKIVISRSLEKVDWNNSHLIREDVAAEITKLKEQPGKNMLIFGSPRTTHLLAQLGLVDEYHLNINPFVLGKGVPIFDEVPMHLKLVDSKIFEGGVVSLHYQVIH